MMNTNPPTSNNPLIIIIKKRLQETKGFRGEGTGDGGVFRVYG
jgi:hypothetical protein